LHIRERGLVRAVVVSVGLACNVTLGLVMIATDTWKPVGASVLLLLASAAVLATRAGRIAFRAFRGAYA
jgi:hypothetical protein